ncbi:MAG TPA: hypothetical protein VE173_00190, partial [Longimicrobiales bacterium]|nr:hypothetical protein [Longimicrobiales bacterium]
LLLVLLGSMRPSGALLLIPMWVYVVWPLAWRHRLWLASVLVVGNLLWLVPLLWLSGGVEAFVQTSRDLVRLVVVPTSVFHPGARGPGPARNVVFVLLGILLGVNFGIGLIAAGLWANPRAFAILSRHRTFLALWLAPPLMTYVFLHTGQVGYVLPILPMFFLLMGVAMEGLASRRSLRSATAATGADRARTRTRSPGPWSAALLVGGHVGIYLLVPPLLWNLGTDADTPGALAAVPMPVPLHRLASHLRPGGVGGDPRQFDVRRNDRYWSDLIRFVRRFAPDRSVVLTAADPSGSFRELTYYLPAYRIYGLGLDLRGRFGGLSTAYGGTSDYSPRNLRTARRELLLPSRVRTLIVPDREIQARLGAGTGSTFVLRSGLKVMAVAVGSRASLSVDTTGSRGATLRVASRRPN